MAFWLYNPVTIMMSTRGSNENIIALLVYATLYYLLRKDYTKAGLLYGLSVHFKIYPIIYSFVFYLFIDSDKASFVSGTHSLFKVFQNGFFTKNRLKFTLISASTFLALTAVFYYIYGYEFLYEAYLYHLIRKDNRHNYSAYFYLIYQTYDMESSALLSVLTFVPQWTVVVIAGLLFYYDVFFAMLLQTWAFVTFNKVCTEQYFLWYLSLAPFVCINSGVIQTPSRLLGLKGLTAMALYGSLMLYMPLWSYHSYLIEHLG